MGKDAVDWQRPRPVESRTKTFSIIWVRCKRGFSNSRDEATSCGVLESKLPLTWEVVKHKINTWKIILDFLDICLVV